MNIKIKTIGFLNLETGQFFKKRVDWVKSIRINAERKRHNLQTKFNKAFFDLCKLEVIKAKAALINTTIYSWIKSCLNATVKRLSRIIYRDCPKEYRALLF
mgnify:FL=1